MKPGRQAFSADSHQARRLVWLMVAMVAVPLVVFTWWVVLQAPSRMDQLTPVQRLDAWHERMGPMVFNQESLSGLVRQAPQWESMSWSAVTLPDFQPLGVSVNVPSDAERSRVWYRIRIPPDLLASQEGRGRLGLLGLRVQGGPWAFWADGQLLEANLSDWRIQWNVPLRLALPLGTTEVMLAVPYTDVLGYSVGSILIGPMDVVDSAWRERNTWHLDLPRFMAGVALLLMLVCFHLAIVRPQEPMFPLLGFNALNWSVSCLQYAFDVTGQDQLSLWFGSAVDASITWVVVLAFIFAFDLERVPAPRLRMALVSYAAISTILTLPVWGWEKNALIAQHYLNVGIFALGLLVLGRHLVQRPRREGWVMFLALTAQLVLGVHTLNNLTNQTNPDSFYSFPIGTLMLYGAFMYAMVRRLGKAAAVAERYELNLRRQLLEQQVRLQAQHVRLQTLEVQRQLSTQHETIMQDLHDTLGSNLTSAILRARSGALTPDEMMLMLQDLASELRQLGRSSGGAERTLNEMLADLRERVGPRLGQGGIALEWAVEPRLPKGYPPQVVQHLRAMLSELVANVIRHAGARHLKIAAGSDKQHVWLLVEDDGRGFDAAQVETGRGMPGLQRRALAIGASLELSSRPGGGCKVEIRVAVPVLVAPV